MIFHEHLLERATYDELGERFGISASRVQQLFKRAAREHIDSIETNLLIARKEGTFFGLAIPAGFEPEQAASIQYLDWCLKELNKRDLSIEVHYRPTPSGAIGFFLEDVTAYSQ